MISCARRRPIRRRLLGARRRDHPSGRAGELCIPRRAHHRHRLPHAERRRARLLAIGVGGADAVEVIAGLPWERALSQAHRRRSDRHPERLDRAEGRHPLRRRPARRCRRHQRDRRILRPRRAHDQRHRQGDDHQHGRRAGRHDLGLPRRRAHGDYLRATRPRRSRPLLRAVPATSWRPMPRSRRDPEQLLRPSRRDRPRRRSSRTSSGRTRRTWRGRSRSSRPRSPNANERSATRSRRPSSAAAPTPRTRTSAAPPTSPSRPRPRHRGARCRS